MPRTQSLINSLAASMFAGGAGQSGYNSELLSGDRVPARRLEDEGFDPLDSLRFKDIADYEIIYQCLIASPVGVSFSV